MFHRVLELLCEAVLLLRESVSELVWDDYSLVGTELASPNKQNMTVSNINEVMHYIGIGGGRVSVGHQTILAQTHVHTVFSCQGELQACD